MTGKSVAILGARGYPSYYGGFETAIRRIAPYLAEQGWEVTVYGRPGATKSDDPSRDPRVRSVETWGFESKSLSTLSFGFTSMWDAMRRKPDVALVMNVANGYWLPLLQLRGIPIVVNVDGIEWERAKWSRLGKFVFKLGARLTARWATRIIVDSKEIGRRWNEEFGRDGDFIPYGGDSVDELPLMPGLTHREYALIVARFVPENTVREFFDAVPELAKHHDVVIVGSSGYGGELDERARELDAKHDRVRWLGHVSDDRLLFSLWQHAGAYFHGHSVGGTNPALVQAMALGAPVVARDTIYNREVLGWGAVLVLPIAEEIEQAIRGILEDPARAQWMASNTRKRATEIYGWPAICAQYAATLVAAVEEVRH